MAGQTDDVHRVLLVDGDVRVLAALAALVDATPGLQVAAATDSTSDVVAVSRTVGATVAVVDVDTGRAEEDLATIHELAGHVPVVAVCHASSGGRRAIDAGATTFCVKNADPDSLTAAVAAAAVVRTARGRTVRDRA